MNLDDFVMFCALSLPIWANLQLVGHCRWPVLWEELMLALLQAHNRPDPSSYESCNCCTCFFNDFLHLKWSNLLRCMLKSRNLRVSLLPSLLRMLTEQPTSWNCFCLLQRHVELQWYCMRGSAQMYRSTKCTTTSLAGVQSEIVKGIHID